MWLYSNPLPASAFVEHCYVNAFTSGGAKPRFGDFSVQIHPTHQVLDPNWNSLLVWMFQRLKIDVLLETKLWVWVCMCKHVSQLGIRNSFCLYWDLIAFQTSPDFCVIYMSSVQKPNEPPCYRSDHNRPCEVIYTPPYWDQPLVMDVKNSLPYLYSWSRGTNGLLESFHCCKQFVW